MNHRVCSRVLLCGLIVGGLFEASALAQHTTTQHTVSSRGLIGQRAAFPNVLGRSRSLPIQRQITLPGLGGQVSYPRSTGGVGGVGAVVGQRGYYHDDGLRVDGRLEGDKFSLNLHLGSGANLLDHGRYYYPYGYTSRGYYAHDGRLYYNPAWYYYSSGTYLTTRPVDGVLNQRVDDTLRSPQVAQPAPTPEPAREWTALEKAHLLMAADELDEAIEAFRDHLDEDAEDVKAMRSLGVAMLEAGRLDDGIAMIAMAYRTDPVLARTALDITGLGLDGLGGRRYDNLLSRVLGFARKTDSGSAHLAGVMLLQADRKVAGAVRVLDRAEKAGLAEEIVDALRRELGVPGRR